jgi:methylmalonyl-CoA/ethylmalonyl-CoA epimerase
MPDQPFGLRRLRQVLIVARDLDRATAFYRDTLGVPFLFRAPPGLAFFDCDGVRLMVATQEAGSEESHTSVLYFWVDDIAAAAAELKARHVEFKQDPHLVAKLPDREVWIAFFRDSEDNLMALMSEPPIKD